MTGGKVRQYPDFVRLFHTSRPLRSVELRMKKESRDLVASTGHLWGKRLDKKTRKTALGLKRKGHKLVFLLLVLFQFSLVYTDRKPGTGYIESLVVEIK